MNELEHQADDVDEVIEPDADDYVDPLDALPPALREPAKAYRSIALLYIVVHNADRFSAIVRGMAANLELLLADVEKTERRDAAAPD